MKVYESVYSRKVVLVTGAAGAIGSTLCGRLLQLGARVIALDDLSTGWRWNLSQSLDLRFVHADILDTAALGSVFALAPAVVFHLAAFFANQRSIENPERDLMVNGLGTLRLLEYSHKYRVDRFVYASSGASFHDDDTPLPLREQCVTIDLASPYQITKFLGEQYCNYFHRRYGLRIVKARLFNSYGPGEIPGPYRNVIPNFVYWAIKHHPLPITGSGKETRDFTYVEDIVDGLLRAGATEVAIGQELNLGSGRETRIQDLAESINKLTANPAGIYHVNPRSWDYKSRRLACIDRAHQLLGYTPSTTLEAGLRNTVQWFHKHWMEIESCRPFAARETPGSKKPTYNLQQVRQSSSLKPLSSSG